MCAWYGCSRRHSLSAQGIKNAPSRTRNASRGMAMRNLTMQRTTRQQFEEEYDEDQMLEEDMELAEGSLDNINAPYEFSPEERKKLAFIADQLLNDESSSDTEMKDHFIEEGLTEDEADFYVKQRKRALKDPISFVIKPYGEMARNRARKSIPTIQGDAYFVRTIVEDKNGRWDNNYYTKDGYWVEHEGKKHHVYKVRNDQDDMDALNRRTDQNEGHWEEHYNAEGGYWEKWFVPARRRVRNSAVEGYISKEEVTGIATTLSRYGQSSNVRPGEKVAIGDAEKFPQYKRKAYLRRINDELRPKGWHLVVGEDNSISLLHLKRPEGSVTPWWEEKKKSQFASYPRLTPAIVRNYGRLRALSSAEIEELASRPGVRRIAVENFLSSVDANPDAMSAGMNFNMDAQMYKWNSATRKAIRDGISRASSG